MNTLPLANLVANFLACEGRPPVAPDEQDIHIIPLDDEHLLGVKMCESGNGVLFFAHPGSDVEELAPKVDDAFDAQSEELELGDDSDGTWLLTGDRTSRRHTLWVRAVHCRVGHVEFARIVGSLRSRFEMWDEVLRGNISAPRVTEGVPLSKFQHSHAAFDQQLL